MKTTKVFIIGFQKTGTTSLEDALKHLGYKVFGGDKNLQKFDQSEDLKKYIKETLKSWDCVQDMPWPIYYKELNELYPEAKFILTLRDTDEWIKSVVRYFASIRIPMMRKIYQVPCAEGYESVYRKVYEKHNLEVTEYFKGKPNFLIMEQNLNFNYKTLCEFLEIESIPESPFPHSRKNKSNFSKYKLYRDIRSLYWNYRKKY